MSILFNFGEKVEAYSYRVINEREARASAGIMFLFGIISLFTVFGMRTMFWAELFSITFIIEFFIRIIINPRYAPYMVLGSLFVSNQEPEWVEAKPKQFAWILGALLGIIMTYFIVADIVSPVRMLTCVLCLVLLFTESAFGICLGCMVYGKFNVTLEGNCPGGVCRNIEKKPAKVRFANLIVLISFAGLVAFTYMSLKEYKYIQHAQSDKLIASKLDNKAMAKATISEIKVEKNPDCIVPQWAIDMGHRDMWKDHNCK